MKTLLTTLIATGILAFGTAASAVTMTLSGDDALGVSLDCESHPWCIDGNDTGVGTYNVNSNFDATIIADITGFTSVVEVHKDEDPYLGGLTFDVGITSDIFYIKDGSNAPKWYIFDISSIANTVDNWDGTVTLTGTWFGVSDNDAISHVSWYTADDTRGLCNPLEEDCGPTVVPIPAAAWLFGSGLIGLVGIGRRKA